MKSFLQFLKSSKNVADKIKKHNCKTAHIVLGNESSDLDSTACTLLFAYFLHKIIYKASSSKHCVFPVLNVSSDEFPLRTEVCYVLGSLGISPEMLIFRNQIDIEMLQQKITDLRVTLVDHHVLADRDNFLKKNVIQIRDHRPVDKSITEYNTRLDCVIKEVASCATLIAEEILKADESLLCKETATLLYYTIIYDTIYLLPENGKVKELDLIIAKKLEEMFNFTEDRKSIYDRLWAVHTDVSHLTPHQLLLADLKIVKSVPVPGLPMLNENFLKLPNAVAAIEAFVNKRGAEVVIITGIETKEEVKRDICVYCCDENNELLKGILMKFGKASLDLVKTDVGCQNILHFRQNNIKASRKQVIPLIQEAIAELDTV